MSTTGPKDKMPTVFLPAKVWIAGLRRKAIGIMFVLLALGLAVGWPFNALTQGQTAHPAITNQSVHIKWDPKYGVGAWIWTTETHDQQLCRLWRGFEIPEGAHVVNARMHIAADDSYSLFLDGREVGRGSGWHQLTEYDLTLLLEPGLHTIAVEAFNAFKQAGVLAGLQIKLADGRTIEIPSDQSWKVVPTTQSRWETRTRANANWLPATIVGTVERDPWPAKPLIFKAPPIYPIVLRFWQTGWFQIMLLSLFAAVATVCMWLIGRLALHTRIQEVVQRERARIARDIHDDLSGGLTQLVLIGEVVQSTLPVGSEPHQQAAIGCEQARGLVRSMHDVIWAIDSHHDTTRDFSSHVCRYAESFLQPTSMHCHFDLDEEMPDFPFDLVRRRNLFLAVKEAIHNAVRHSGAGELVLRIARRGNAIVVTIEDNGKGFEPALRNREGNGLSNMMKRAEDAGGTCSIVSRPAAGCRVVLTVPFVPRAKSPVDWLVRVFKPAGASKSQQVGESPQAGVSQNPI